MSWMELRKRRMGEDLSWLKFFGKRDGVSSRFKCSPPSPCVISRNTRHLIQLFLSIDHSSASVNWQFAHWLRPFGTTESRLLLFLSTTRNAWGTWKRYSRKSIDLDDKKNSIQTKEKRDKKMEDFGGAEEVRVNWNVFCQRGPWLTPNDTDRKPLSWMKSMPSSKSPSRARSRMLPTTTEKLGSGTPTLSKFV